LMDLARGDDATVYEPIIAVGFTASARKSTVLLRRSVLMANISNPDKVCNVPFIPHRIQGLINFYKGIIEKIPDALVFKIYYLHGLQDACNFQMPTNWNTLNQVRSSCLYTRELSDTVVF